MSDKLLTLAEEITLDLSVELNAEPSFKANVLRQKVKAAIREVKLARRYPSSYTASMISEDLQKYYSNIRNIALYDYNQVGAEFQQSHGENEVSRAYTDRNLLFKGIVPIASF